MSQQMTQEKFDKIIEDLSHVQREVEADGIMFDDCMAFEIAQNFIREEEGLAEYIVNVIGAKDYVGYLANQM